jgi:hypothetical protein
MVRARIWLWLIGCGFGVGCSSTAGMLADGGQKNPVSWMTETVTLTASDFWIVADGQVYGKDRAGLDIHSDPGSPTYTTLELTWTERGNPMRFFIYLHADPSHWWSDEMRTYDGQSDGDWLFYRGTYFSAPIGQTFHGDLDLTNAAEDQFRGELHLHGLALSTTMRGG